jgi:hypothetical protein
MFRNSQLGLLVLACLASGPAAHAGNSLLLDPELLPQVTGLSADGRLVVYRDGYWDRVSGVRTDLSLAAPAGGWGAAGSGRDLVRIVEVRSDGQAALAQVELANGSGDQYMAHWGELGGWSWPASTVPGCGPTHIEAIGMSEDGQLLVGNIVDPACEWYAASWTPGAQPDPVKLTTIVFDPSESPVECSRTTSVSADGSLIGGFHSKFGCDVGPTPGDVEEMAAVWDAATGAPRFLEDGVDGRVLALSADGSVAVGRSTVFIKHDAVIWDLTVSPAEAQLLGLVSADPFAGDGAEARTVSGDGDLVTGSWGDFADPWAPHGAAFYWKRHVNGDPATGRALSMAQRVAEAGDAFPRGASDMGGQSGPIAPTLVATEVRASAGANGGTLLYDVQLPGGIYSGMRGDAAVIDLPLLEGSASSIDLTVGGAQVFDIDAGPGQAHQLYLLLGSASGTTPGWTVGPANEVDVSVLQDRFDLFCNFSPGCTAPGTLPADYSAAGDMVLPLAPDNYFLATATTLFGLWPFNSFGFLDANGRAGAAFIALPAGDFTSFAGSTLHHAYVVLDNDDLTARAVSNAVPCNLVL